MAQLVLGPNRAYPSIPAVTGEVGNHTLVLEAIREALAIHERRTRNVFDSFVRLDELVELGLVGVDGATGIVVAPDPPIIDIPAHTHDDLYIRLDGLSPYTTGTILFGADIRLANGAALLMNDGGGTAIETLIMGAGVPGGTPTPDPNLGSVTYLASFENGTAGAEVYTPEIGPSMNWSIVSGTQPTQVDGEISTAQAKFGTQSLYFKETFGAPNAGWASDNKVAGTTYGFAGDFTIETHIYIVDNTSEIVVLGLWDFTERQWILTLEAGNGRLNFVISTTGSDNPTMLSQHSWGVGTGVPSGAWHHIAVCRSGNNWYAFLDGVQSDQGTQTLAYTIYQPPGGAYLVFGQYGFQDGGSKVEVYLDNVRITDGVARYTTGFTPPTLPFDGSSGDTTLTFGDPTVGMVIDASALAINADTSITGTLDVSGDTTIAGGIQVLSGEFTAISSATTSDLTVNSVDGYARLYILSDTTGTVVDASAVPAIVMQNDGATAQRLVIGKNQSSTSDAVGNVFNSIASAWGFHLTGSGYSFAFGVNGNADWIINQSYVQHFAGTTQNVTYTFVGGDYQVAPAASPDYWHYMSGWDSVRFDQPLLVQERAAAITDVAGYGQLWVLNGTPNELWFTDDTGVDYKVAPNVSAIDDGTVNDAVARWDTGSSQWVEETQVRVSSAGALTILDAGLTDSAAHSHDGTDYNTVFTTTTDWNISGLTGGLSLVDVDLIIHASTDTLTISGDGTDFNFVAGGSVSDLNWSGFQFFNLDNGFLRIVEQASPPATGPGYGLYWVLSGASNTPVYQDDNGLDYELNTTDSSFNMTYLFESTVAAPTTYQVTLNNANQTLATEVRVHAQGVNRQRISNQVFMSNSTVFPTGTLITLQMSYDTQDRFRVYRTTGNPVNNGSYVTFPVTYVTGSGTLTDGVRMRVNFQRPAGATINQGTVDTAMLRWDSATASWVESSRLRLSSGGVLGLYDGTGADSMTIVNNGTNVDFNFTGVTNVQWLGIGNNILMRSTGGFTGQGILNNTGFTFTYAEELLNMEILNTPTNFDIAGLASGTGIMWLRDGARFRVSDAADTDWGQSRHDGTDFHWDFTNTAELNINNVPVHLAEGSLFMTEKAAADADTAGRGQIWVKNDAPNTLWFTDDTGVDYEVIPQTKFKSGDTARNTTTAVADDAHIAGFNLLTDAYYSVEGVLVVNSASATPDFDFVFQFSNAEQLSRLSVHAIDAALNETLYSGNMVTEVTIPITATDKNVIYIRGFFRSNATTGGTLDLQWAQNTSDATDVTLEAGSWVRIQKM